jgi:hypothetical protein
MTVKAAERQFRAYVQAKFDAKEAVTLQRFLDEVLIAAKPYKYRGRLCSKD